MISAALGAQRLRCAAVSRRAALEQHGALLRRWPRCAYGDLRGIIPAVSYFLQTRFSLIPTTRCYSSSSERNTTHESSNSNSTSNHNSNDTTANSSSTNNNKNATPTNVTNEPASIVHFTQSSTRHPFSETPLTPPDGAHDSDPVWHNPVPHPVYDLEEIAHIERTHHEPKLMHERAALLAVKIVRAGFDVVSGYRGPGGAMTEREWLNRCLFLESIAGVPGMVAGMTRHLHSIRSMRRDYGWIHTLLEEAENERMHLLIFMSMKQPDWFFRLMVLGAQGVFFSAFFLSYLASPRTCHRFVGYLEEEAVKTYTGLLQDIEDGHLKEWSTKQAPLIARSYYNLPDSSTIFDMVKCVRADEANHRDVNHTFAGLDQKSGVNPYTFKSHHK